MRYFLLKHKYVFLLWIFISAYIAYFSYFTILRMKTLYASYYDLGIMNQTVFNTYKGLQTGDFSRLLELTDVNGPDQIKRMSIHNDVLLALIAPLYFIHAGPETLLVLQTCILALGALAVFLISRLVLDKIRHRDFFALLFAGLYLLYFPLERANIFDFHAVVLGTTFLLFMFYFWLRKKYWFSFTFFIVSILSKEQVALTTLMFGLYTFVNRHGELPRAILRARQSLITKLLRRFTPRNDKEWYFSFFIVSFSLLWFILSVFIIIPYFRGGHHFALERYSDFGDSPTGIIIGVLATPYSIIKHFVTQDILNYFFYLLGPLSFISLLSPLVLLISLPELLINILSNDGNMINVIYHYTAVITPFIFISAIYGVKKLLNFLHFKDFSFLVGVALIFSSFLFSYFKGPLPFSKETNIHPFLYPQKEARDVLFWSNVLRDEKYKISTTGQLAPFFTSRRYFYNFSKYYPLADYIVLRLNEIYEYPEKEELIPVYEKLKTDYNYKLIFKRDKLEIYKKINLG